MKSLKQWGVASLAAAACWAAGPTFALDLKQAYALALANDSNMGAARAAARIGQENVPQAQAQMLPNISASFSRNNSNLVTRTPNSLGQVSESYNTYPSLNDGLTVRQPIYRKYQIAQYQQAQAQANDATAMLDFEVQNLAVRLGGGYFEALLAEEQLALVQTQLRTYKSFVVAAKRMFEGGSGTRTDIDEAQSRLDMSIAQELEARQAVDYTRQQLQVMVGEPVGTLAKLSPALLPLIPPEPADVDVWIERAQRANSELRVLSARADIARLEIEKARSGHHPTLDAVAQWGRSSSESSQSINTQYETRSVGLQLVIPIYSGGGVNAAVRQAVASKERAEQLWEAGRRDIGVRVRKEFRGVSEGVLRVRALEQAVRSSELALASSEKSFLAGVRTRLDVLNAESARMSSLKDLAQARLVYLMAKIKLHALVEDANFATIESMNSAFVSP